MSRVDMRGFSYPLEAVLQRRQWSIDKTQSQIAAARGVCDGLERKLRELIATLAAHASSARKAWRDSPDLAARDRMLGYLAFLQQQKSQLDMQLQAAREELRLLEEALKKEMIRLNVLEEHRLSLREDYVLEQARIAEASSDAQWLTLRGWRRKAVDGQRA